MMRGSVLPLSAVLLALLAAARGQGGKLYHTHYYDNASIINLGVARCSMRII